jgi:hypothetical protein|tara:strand:- start:1778 stop:2089 length:312 start_codon:yes stop_codon:yes gene_type:complete
MKNQKVVEHTYTWLKYILIILYIVGLFGIWSDSGKYLMLFDSIFNIMIAGVLIYFFNPFKKTVCNDFHRKVVFSAGIAILLQTSITQYFNPLTRVKNVISKSF